MSAEAGANPTSVFPSSAVNKSQTSALHEYTRVFQHVGPKLPTLHRQSASPQPSGPKFYYVGLTHS